MSTRSWLAFLTGFIAFLVVVSLVGFWIAALLGTGAGVLFDSTVGKPLHAAEERRKQEYRERVRQIMLPHLPALLRRKRQLDRLDDYGIRDDRKWIKEVNHFCDNVVSPALGLAMPPTVSGARSQPRRLSLDLLVDDLAEKAASERRPDFAHQFDPAMSPIDYEHFCAERLRLSGWDPTITQASGDQGADIVAARGAQTIVVQCKHYSKPVGNKAVQEVTAAMRHYSASAAVVIATNGFTRSAEQLATSNGVTLLSHDDLTADWRLPTIRP